MQNLSFWKLVSKYLCLPAMIVCNWLSKKTVQWIGIRINPFENWHKLCLLLIYPTNENLIMYVTI
jgi:hypothetical protein